MNFLIALAAGSGITIGEALGNMIVGFGIVFLSLLFLCGVIYLFKFIGKLDKTAKKPAAQTAPEKKAPEAPAAPAKPEGIGGEDGAVIAAIIGAVMQHCGPNAVVTSITRSK